MFCVLRLILFVLLCEPKQQKKEESGDGEHKTSAIEEELAVNASEEYELEQMRERAEKELIEREVLSVSLILSLFDSFADFCFVLVCMLCGMQCRTLLSVFGPLLVRVCSHPQQYADNTLQTSAVLALCKCMVVSADFCEANLRLLFTILHTSKDPKIRANIVISLGTAFLLVFWCVCDLFLTPNRGCVCR
jgi:hypothetical protein